MDLTDEQWTIIEPLIAEAERQPNGPCRPWRDAREVMNGILWILRMGVRWQDLPDRYPAYQTCHRRFQQWVDSCVFDHMLQAIADDLLHREQLDLSKCFIDCTFTRRRVPALGRSHFEPPFFATEYPLGEGTKIMAMADGWSSSRRPH